MPLIDSQTGSLTLRVVYDGQPLAGKTTTVRALAERVRGTRGLTTPAESRGRTLYFDWLEFVGGEFGGREIRVQVISVPGQPELRHRRNYLIQQADAVVFVADSHAEHFSKALELFGELVTLTRNQVPPVGVVFQANKRDQPHALDTAVIRQMLQPFGRVTLIDSVATDGDGIREAFAMGLRSALDRAQGLAAVDGLLVGDLEIRSATDLLGRIQETEPADGASRTLATESARELDNLGLESSSARDSWAAGSELSFAPDARLPSGHIWPPVDGRAIVHEASQAGVVPVRASSGDWWASIGGWRLHSSREAIHEDVVVARGHLIEWARLHAANVKFLSPDRALLLADAGSGQYRLWQLVRVLPSLKEGLLSHETSPRAVARRVCKVAQLLMQARQETDKLGGHVRCSLWTIGEDAFGQPVFVGLMPRPNATVGRELSGAALLERELKPVLRGVLERVDAEQLVASLREGREEVAQQLVQLIQALQMERA